MFNEEKVPGEPLHEWFDRQRAETPDEMFYKSASGSQIMFARDDLHSLIAAGLTALQDRLNVATVISTHRSKSVVLPVYSFDRPDIGLRLIARDNFYTWKLSVISETPVVADFSGLFKTTPPIDPEYTGDQLHRVYFEGFPKHLIFGYYEPSDKRRWSAEIRGDHAMWATVFLIMRALGVIKPMAWSTRKDAS